MFKPITFNVLLMIGFAVLPVGTDANKAPDYTKEAFVLEQSSDKFKFSNDGSYTREIRTRTRVQSDAGVEHFSVVKFAFQNSLETFAIDYLRVTKPDGTTVVTPPDTYQDMPADITRQAPFYSDAHEMQVAVKGLGVGDVLEYQAHWQHTKPLIPGQFWLEYNFAHSGIVLEEKLEVSLPRGRKIKLKSTKLQPTVSQSGDYDVYSWTSANLENKEDKKEKQEQQREVWEQVRGRQPVPEVQLSSFQSWDEVAKWYGTLQRERVHPTAEIQTKAAELTKGAADQSAQVHALYDFVSTKYRYIGIAFGIGRYQSHFAAEVLANQYGDCKDKHTLFASLLNAAGIKAYPALVSSTHDIDAEVPSPGQFDHVITAVPQGAGFVWLDTTAEVAPFAVLMPALRDKHALVISDDAAAALANTPADDPFPAVQKFEMQAKLSDAGVLEGKADNTDRGDTEVLFRSVFRMVPLPRWKDLVQQISNNLGFAGDVSGVDATPPEKTAEAFHFSYAYKRKDYSDWGNRRITPPLPSISLPAVDDDIVPTAPIWLGSPGEIDFHATLELPKGYTPDLPKAVHVKRDFADYDATYSFSSGVITSARHITIKLREVPAGEYAEYKSFRKAVDDDYGTYTSLSIGKRNFDGFAYEEEIWNLPYSDNNEAARLYDDARAQFQRNDVQGEIASLKHAVEIDPKFVRAWLWLGQIYRSSGQFDMALQTYRKAIEIDPEQPVGYKALGITLAMMNKTEDAIGVWQQLTKVAPNLVDGYEKWGSMLLYSNRYVEAIPPLETALKLDPEEPTLYLSLGAAYLNSGKVQMARASFEKAITFDSGALMLNNVAILLANQKTDLEKAKDYALKAVNQEEEESLKIQLSSLQKEDLGHSRRLAAFWDTLGWTMYQLNDLPSAESYINAAWLLSQSPGIGEHLGRVYEKENRKQQAIRAYQLAEVAPPIYLIASPGNIKPSGKDAPSLKQDLRRLGSAPGPSTLMSDLNELRTFKMPRLVSGTANAEFFILLGPGSKVEAKFISGSESLKPASKTLESARFRFAFPDQNPVRILRRGIVGCYPSSGCSFVMMPPSAVFSLQ